MWWTFFGIAHKSSELGPPLPAGVCAPPPLVLGGGHSRLRERGGGGGKSQFGRWDTDCGTPGKYVPGGFIGHVRKRPYLICGSVAWVHSLMGCLFSKQFINHQGKRLIDIRLLIHPLPLPLSSQQLVSLSQSSCVSILLTGEGGKKPNHTTPRKPGTLLKKYSLVATTKFFLSFHFGGLQVFFRSLGEL
jgi:hypothetical protein